MFGFKSKKIESQKKTSPKSKYSEELQNRLSYSRRIYLVLIIITGGLIILFSRSYYLQIFRYDYYRTRSEKNRVNIQVIPPLRGNIYDRNGTALSENILIYNLIANRSKNKDIDLLINKISHYMRFDHDDLYNYKLDKRKKLYSQDIVVRTNLTKKEMNLFLVDLYKFPGFDIVPNYKRYYPHGQLTAHIVGYINNINKKDLKNIDNYSYSGTTKIGRTGIEKEYENILHGKAGVRQAEVTRTGKVVRILKQKNPIPGNDLYLSLDIRLQKIIREELEKETYDGAGVAIDPNNGQILAMFSNPSFDTNLFVNGISHKDYNFLRNSPRKNLFNRALNGTYSPASTIKPMMALAGLYYDVIDPSTKINCKGSYKIPDYKTKKTFYCWKRSGHGNMNASTSITQSCDVFYYSIGKELGIDRINDYLIQFGLGVKTGVDLPNESSGILPSRSWKMRKYKKSWFIGDTINASIGQGYVLTTPIQMAYFTSILASRGKCYKPHFLTHYSNPISGKVNIPRDSINHIKQNNLYYWNIVDKAMVDVMSGHLGTARRIKINLPFKIAGKTGTAQVISLRKGKRRKNKYVKKAYRDNSVFIAYAPSENPVISFSLILENAGGGSEAAAPIAIKILERYFKNDLDNV